MSRVGNFPEGESLQGTWAGVRLNTEEFDNASEKKSKTGMPLSDTENMIVIILLFSFVVIFVITFIMNFTVDMTFDFLVDPSISVCWGLPNRQATSCLTRVIVAQQVEEFIFGAHCLASYFGSDSARSSKARR
jgi:hypothetical protein